MFYLGLPQWQHAAWAKIGLHDLADYSRHFNCVEGNTTFYALPTPALVRRWRDMTHDGFRFCFKFPSAISHQAALLHCDQQIGAFYRALQPLDQRLGQLWLQLPAACGPEHLPRLWSFLDTLPCGYRYGVEVRHTAFLPKATPSASLTVAYSSARSIACSSTADRYTTPGPTATPYARPSAKSHVCRRTC